jgi:membrane protein DedA with SNARE-associated domain
MENVKRFWAAAEVPVIGLLVLLAIYFSLGLIFHLPADAVLIPLLKGYIKHYGYPLVLVGSFLEALLLIGWYFPGSLIIFLSVILAPSPQAAVVSVCIVTVGLYSGYVVNFFLGTYGWYRLFNILGMQKPLQEAKIKLQKHGSKAIFMTYWNPGLASFISTAAGVLHYDKKQFLVYSFVAVCVWDVFWGVVVYSLGERSLEAFFNWPFILFITLVWIGIRYWENSTKTAF